MTRTTLWGVLTLAAIVAACAGPDTNDAAAPEDAAEEAAEPPTVEATSLFGEPLVPMELSAEARAGLEANLAEAQARYDEDPENVENIIWLGRRLAYLWRYRDAIEVFSRGIELHPEDFRLYRHRGHRYISVRRFDDAAADLERAAELSEGVPDEVEEDGAPNAAGIPRSTSHSNIWYHLALAYYLQGDFERAAEAYEKCTEYSRVNDDMLVATADWQYMTYRRLGRDADAARVLEEIEPEMDVIENFAYHRRLLMYKGLIAPGELLEPDAEELDIATQGYGVANFHFVNGEVEEAKTLLERVLAGRYWAAFGYIAAEADLKRMADEEGS